MSRVPTVVSLSAIPPRFSSLRPTLRSLLAQNLPVDEVRLYIPERYRRFPEWNGTLPEVPAGVIIHRTPADLGPATKLLPVLRDLEGQAVDVLVCDDDKLYHPGWHGRFKRAREQHPDACIVEVGETFPDIADTMRPADRLPRARWRPKDWRYRLIRLLTLGRYKPNAFESSGFVDQISGYGGVMVRPGWLGPEAWDIPTVLWTVDDPWISGHLERAGIPIWLNASNKLPKDAGTGRISALLYHVEEGCGRVEADLAAIEYFRQTYGIWLPAGPVEGSRKRMTPSMRRLVEEARAKG
ncbi:glycosyltransferase family A protein [Nitratireductor indicus]|uniref:glycosyltransferase family A protein n=1 Tax=Nitratireductor indicus TaxID=721133 RepID=UPI002874F563|nr:glycosyltransferase family A protein [Nitratireductor indicus]MDS1135969.1 glycosyltransferase family A protein [Nitratireductor indicus]